MERINTSMRAPGRLAKAQSAKEALERRKEDLLTWLEANAPEVPRDQRHLDEGSVERAYWHYGYATAISDVLALLGSASTIHH